MRTLPRELVAAIRQSFEIVKEVAAAASSGPGIP